MVVCKILYQRTFTAYRMFKLERFAVRIRLHNAHKFSTQTKQSPNTPIRRIGMSRVAQLESSVLKAIVDITMHDVGPSQPEDALRQTIRVDIVGIIVLDCSCCIIREQPTNRRKNSQWQQFQPKADFSLPLLLLCMTNQLVGKYSEKLSHNLQKVPMPLGSRALSDIGPRNFPVP